jgi:hypothetical protein
MKPGRILAVLGALSLVCLGAGTVTARAANEIVGQFDAPVSGVEFATSATDLRGHFTMPNGGTVTDITVSVHTPDGTNVGQSFNQPSNGSFEWIPPAWRWNGAYTATAVGNGRTSDFINPQNVSTQTQVTFYVSAPPQTPSGVTAQVDDAQRMVTVSWRANPEPDIQFYAIGRYLGSSSTGTAFYVDATTTSYVDKLGTEPAGAYHYDIYAVRAPAKPKSEKSIASKSAGTANATVRSSPPTTSTSTPSTPGGGGTAPTTGSPGSAGSGGAAGSNTAQRGKVDVSGFGSLLGHSSGLPATRSSSPPVTLEPDAGFDSSLPYGARPKTATPQPNDNTALGSSDAQPLSSSKERPTSLLFLAAGLLATVLLMHLLWVKSEVDRSPLDPLPAPMPRRARHEPRLP